MSADDICSIGNADRPEASLQEGAKRRSQSDLAPSEAIQSTSYLNAEVNNCSVLQDVANLSLHVYQSVMRRAAWM